MRAPPPGGSGPTPPAAGTTGDFGPFQRRRFRATSLKKVFFSFFPLYIFNTLLLIFLVGAAQLRGSRLHLLFFLQSAEQSEALSNSDEENKETTKRNYSNVLLSFFIF